MCSWRGLCKPWHAANEERRGEIVPFWRTQGVTQRMRAGLQQSGQGGQHTDVLNGIAWDEAGRRLFVTGKLWPTLYQARVGGRTVCAEG